MCGNPIEDIYLREVIRVQNILLLRDFDMGFVEGGIELHIPVSCIWTFPNPFFLYHEVTKECS